MYPYFKGIISTAKKGDRTDVISISHIYYYVVFDNALKIIELTFLYRLIFTIPCSNRISPMAISYVTSTPIFR